MSQPSKGAKGGKEKEKKKSAKTKSEGKEKSSSRGQMVEPRGESLDVTDAGLLEYGNGLGVDQRPGQATSTASRDLGATGVTL